MSSSWSRPNNAGTGRWPAHHGDSNNEEGEISSSSWGPPRTENAMRLPPHSSTNQPGDPQSFQPRSDPRIDRVKSSSYISNNGILTGVPPVSGHRNVHPRNDRDPRFKATSAPTSGRFNSSSSINPTNNNSYSNPGSSWQPPDRDRSTNFNQRRAVSEPSPKHTGGIHPYTPSNSRNFSFSDLGPRNEFHQPVDGRDQSSSHTTDGIGVPMPGPKSSSVGGGGKVWKSNANATRPNSAGSNNWTESGPREKKFTSWPSKPTFPFGRNANFHEGAKVFDTSDTRPAISDSGSSFFNKFDRRAPPGGWERDRKFQNVGGGGTSNVPPNNRDYYGPSTSTGRDRSTSGYLPQETIQNTWDTIQEGSGIDSQPIIQTSYLKENQSSDGDSTLHIRKIPSESEAMDVGRGYEVPPLSDGLQRGGTLPSSHEAKERIDGSIVNPAVVVTVPDVKAVAAFEASHPAPPSPDQKTGTSIRITVSALASEEKISKAESVLKRLSEIMFQDDLNVRKFYFFSFSPKPKLKNFSLWTQLFSF